MESKDTPAGEDEKRLVIPRLSYPYLETLIVREDYHHFADTGVTVCCLVVTNGYSVTADAVCANTALFDPDTGRLRARRKALKRLMELEHYLLRQRLFDAGRYSEGRGHG